MFRVLPVCRLAVTVIWRLISAGVFFVAGRVAAALFLFAGGVWLQLYLNGLTVTINDGVIIKYTGNMIKRKTVFVLKSSVRIQTAVVHPVLPAIIRLVFQSRNIYIWGLDGRQVTMIEKHIMSMFRE